MKLCVNLVIELCLGFLMVVVTLSVILTSNSSAIILFIEGVVTLVYNHPLAIH